VVPGTVVVLVGSQFLEIRATVGSWKAPGMRPETHWISPSGAEMTCRFMPWRCLPE
jgi:hypothetical protein